MPKNQPTLSWEQIRNYTEKWSWIDARTGKTRTGFNPPANAKQKHQMPYYVRYITSNGEVEEGEVITLKVFNEVRQRMIRFTASGEIRRIRDYLIIEVDGVRFQTH